MIEDLDDNKQFIRCELCGGYGYRYLAGSKSAVRCESCHGDKRSRNPKHYQR